MQVISPQFKPAVCNEYVPDRNTILLGHFIL